MEHMFNSYGNVLLRHIMSGINLHNTRKMTRKQEELTKKQN